jgi:hypothetical protein
MKNGGQYEGKWKGGKANGWGRYILPDEYLELILLSLDLFLNATGTTISLKGKSSTSILTVIDSSACGSIAWRMVMENISTLIKAHIQVIGNTTSLTEKELKSTKINPPMQVIFTGQFIYRR